MALEFYVSNNLLHLANKLSERESSIPRPVFQPQVLVTQVEGMNLWIRDRLAESMGIAANISFVTPNQLINKVFFALGGEFQNPISENSVAWIVHHILGTTNFRKRFKSIASYYEEEKDLNAMKQFHLAQKITDLFDQYQIYRPDMIREWNTSDEKNMNDWQQYIWIKAREIAKNRFPDKTFMGDYIIEALKIPDAVNQLKEKLPDISLFGLSVITGFHIQLILELSKHISVKFFLLNPSPEYYWIDEKSPKELARLKPALSGSFAEGNELLSELGKVQRDTFKQLFAYEEVLNAYETVELSEPEPNSLLHQIQQEIFYSINNDHRSPISQDVLKDGSITIHSNYTEARSVESLYNYLVDLSVQALGNLNPSDVLVLLTDVNTYEPYIRAVFDNAPYYFPYTIADTSLQQEDSYLAAYLKILNLSEEAFTAEAILDLLVSQSIQDRLGITDIELIRHAVASAGIRFGIDNDIENETRLVSWEYGLQRMMYGIVMQQSPLIKANKEEFIATDVAEGMSTDNLVSFYGFVDRLMRHMKSRKRNRTIGEWAIFFQELAETFLASPDGEQYEAIEHFNAALSNFQQTSNILSDKYSFNVVAYALASHIEGATTKRMHMSRGITFCSFIPMRSIPYKYVCILGLNNSVFPRLDHSFTFDKIQEAPRIGDRSTKDNDKNLFLETLVSAGEKLYISYIGRRPEDNSLIPPSSVIDTLLGYIAAKTVVEQDLSETFIIQQPLHSYSRHFNQKNGALKNYLLEDKPPINYLGSTNNSSSSTLKTINLKSIIAFYDNGIKYYFNQKAGIYFENFEDITIPEHEKFELDNLDNSILSKEIILEKNKLQDYIKYLKLTGQIPLANMGKVHVEQLALELEPFKIKFQELAQGNDPATYTNQIIIHGIELQATIQDVYGNNLIKICSTGSPKKHIQRLYLSYLFHLACDFENSEAWLINTHLGISKIITLTKDEAINRLSEIVADYLKHEQHISPYYSGVKMENVKDDYGKFLKEVESSEAYNPYVTVVNSQQYFTQSVFETFLERAKFFENIIDTSI